MPAPAISPPSRRVPQLIQAANLTDAGVVIGTARGVLFKQYLGAGAYDDSMIIPLASASKMLSDVRIMRLVDRGSIWILLFPRICLSSPMSTKPR